MSSWLVKLMDIVWTSVLSVVFSLLSITFAIFLPNAIGLTIAFAGTAITFALLAQKE